MEWIIAILVVAVVMIIIAKVSITKSLRENRELLEQIATQLLELKHGLAPMIKREQESFLSTIELGQPEQSERAIQIVRQTFETKAATGQQEDKNLPAQEM